MAECLEQRLPLTVSAIVASPADNGPADLDPTVGAISVQPLSQFVIQLSTDNGAAIADATVTPSAVAMSVGGEPLVAGVDYQFGYIAASDQITLTSVNPRFAINMYDLIVSPNNQIQDNDGASLPATTFHINVTDIVPIPITPLFSYPPQGGLIYNRTIDVPTQTAVVAGTSFEEPPLNATSYAGGGGELGWTRTLSNGTPGVNAVFGVKNSAAGLGAPAFPPPGGGTKAYVSRGNGPQVVETLTFDPVDLTGRTDVTFSMNVFRSNTGFENNDRLTITLALFDGTSTTNQVLLNLTGSQLFNLNAGGYTPLGWSIGSLYTRAQLIIQASTNSNQNPPDEVLVYDNIEFRAAAVGGTSYYYVDLDAGQSLTAALYPAATFRPQMQITGPGLPTATAEASQAGEVVRIADYAVPIAGRYLIAISGLDDTAGYSSLTLYTNTTLETEQFVGGSPNDDQATAQDIDAAFISVDGSTSRAGVVGNGESASDFYSFTLLPNESASVAVYGIYGYAFSVDLYDSAETHLASGVTANNAHQIINHFRSVTGGTYYVRVTGTFSPYGLVVFRNAIYEQDRASQIVPLGLNQAGVAMGYADYFSGLSSDFYQLSLVAGQPIRIATTTPGDGPLEFVNALDPNIEIYDSSFNPIFSAQGGNPDKRNVDVEYVAETSGTYFLRVYSDGTQGEYTVRVTGLEPVLPPFSVTFTSPQDGESLPYMPTEMWVDFNRPISPGSVQADDLTVNGVPATEVRLYDGDTLIFTLPEIAEATANVAIAGGAILDIQELPVDAYSGQFFFDSIAPRIVSSSIQEGGVLAPGDFTYVVEFSEPMNTFGLTNSEFSLVSSNNSQFFPQSASFDDSGTILTIAYGALPDDRYTLTLFSGAGSLIDRAGHALDGEAPNGSLPPAVSGDGIDGGNFSVRFYADVAVAPLGALVAQLPLGSLIYGTSTSAGIQVGDTDRFTLELPAGYQLSVAVTPSATLQPHLTVEGPLYHTLAASPSMGSDAVVQLLTIPADGEYTFRISGMGGSAGTYRLGVTLNAALESEGDGVPGNETPATAQSLDAAMIPLGGSSWRGAVAGDFSPPLGYPGPQFANSVIEFSSQADTFYNGAIQALGAPDATYYGGDSRAWAPSLQNDGLHYLALGFARPAYSDGITIREVSGNGFVTRIDLLDVDDVYHTVWSGVDLSPAGALFDFAPTWPLTEYLVKGAKIYVDTDRDQNMWEEIDSVQLKSPADLIVDHYAFHADSGDILSISARGPAASLALELLDGAGQIVATGSALGSNVDSMIAAYSAPGSGTYYARLSGSLGSSYNLVVMRNATFGLETNNSLATAHNLSESGSALGFVNASSEGNLAAGLVTPPVPTSLPVYLTDSAGFLWDIFGDGEIGDGTNDAYDGGMVHSGFPFLSQGQIEDGGREVIIGPTTISPVQVTRKIYVPTDQNFARFLEIVTNTTANTVSYSIPIFTNLGSDGGTELVTTASGDATFATTDDWIVTDDFDNGGDPTLLHVVAGPGGLRPTAVEAPTGALNYSYGLSLAPGQTKIVMHFASQNASRALAIAKGPQLQRLELNALEGMSAEELSQVVNFSVADADDFYSLEVAAGEVIDLRTFTPGDGLRGAGGLVNPVLTLYDPNGGLIAIDGDSSEDGRNAHLRVEAPIDGLYKIHVGSTAGDGEYLLRAMTLGTPAVVGRKLFYNHSAFDGTAGPSASDDLAIATDKAALLPGGTATFSNYTSYSRGINGLMIDIAALPTGALSASDFSFKVGNDDNSAGWADAPAPSISVRGGAGVGGSDRVTLIWPDQAIQKQWLQVTVLANASTGLIAPDVFYFGNAIGESGAGNMAGYATVTATDEIGARNNPKTLFPASNQAAITYPYDYNRDKKVGAADQIIARNHVTNVSNALRLISVPVAQPVVGQALATVGLVPSGLDEGIGAGGSATRPREDATAVTRARTGSTIAEAVKGEGDRRAIENVFAQYGVANRGRSGDDALHAASDELWMMAVSRHRVRRSVDLSAPR